MSARVQLYIVVFILISLGLGLTVYKNQKLGFPLMPGAKDKYWVVEAKLSFEATGGPVQVSLAIPTGTDNLQIVDEQHVCPWYGFSRQVEDGQLRGVFSKRSAVGPQEIYYQVRVAERFQPAPDIRTEKPQRPFPPSLEDRYLNAAKAFNDFIRGMSSDPRTFTTQLILRLNDPHSLNAIASAKALQDLYSSSVEKADLIIDLLHLEGIPARINKGFYLGEGKRYADLQYAIEIYDGESWENFDINTGTMGLPDNFLVWQRSGDGLLDVFGARNSVLSFSTLSEMLPGTALAITKGEHANSPMVDFSIYSLPIEIQNVFKLLLLTPVGALIIVLMRNVVGFRTSGTFLPVLIALSFRQTELIPGLIIFVLVVSIGLAFRAYLSRLNLLLVPRLSAVVIIVITMMAFLSIFSYKLGIMGGLKVTFFPIIILSWTVERMSVLWEEDGPKEVMIQGLGSIIVAIVTYLVMGVRFVQHLSFAFPELILVVLAVILLIGQYNGYRLTELRRFIALERG